MSKKITKFMKNILIFFFSDFQSFRKYIGGFWYQIRYSVFDYEYNTEWISAKKDDEKISKGYSCEIINEENYE